MKKRWIGNVNDKRLHATTVHQATQCALSRPQPAVRATTPRGSTSICQESEKQELGKGKKTGIGQREKTGIGQREKRGIGQESEKEESDKGKKNENWTRV